MPDAFVLFGELKTDTASFENALRAAEARLETTGKAIEQTERRAASIGGTTAVSSRGFEKLNETLTKAQERLNVTATAFNKGEASSGQMRSALLGVEKASDTLNNRLKDTSAKLTDVENKSKSFGSSIKQGLSGIMSLLPAFTISLNQLPAQIEAVANKIVGLGKNYADAGTAIYLAAQKTALSAEALSTVKAAADVSGSSIEEFSSGFTKFEKNLATGGGKVKGTFAQMGIDIAAGTKNPEAAFGQFLEKFRELPAGADRAAIAIQLFGKAGANQIPTFLKLAESGKTFQQLKDDAVEMGIAFDTNGAKKAKLLEDAFTGIGKASKGLLFSFAGGFAESLTGLLQSLSGAIKTLRPAFAEIGRYAGAAMAGIAEAVSGVINYFKNLSPEAQKAVGVFTVVAGAVGTVVAAIAGFAAAAEVSTIFAAVSAAAAAAAAALSEIIVPILAAAAAAAALYLAWQTDFGGIKTYTLEVWEAVKSATSTAVNAIYDLTQSVGGQIVAWWKDNYPLIQETVKTVSDAIRAVVGSFLAAVADFWKQHGEQITAVVKAAWNYISGFIKSSVELIGGILKTVMQAINGDWSGAWETVGKTVGRSVSFTTETVKNALGGIKNLVSSAGTWLADNWQTIMVGIGTIVAKGIAAIVTAFVNLPFTIAALVPKFIAAGASIGTAIYKGFKEGVSQIDAAAAVKLPDSFYTPLAPLKRADSLTANGDKGVFSRPDNPMVKSLDLVSDHAKATKKHVDALTEATKTWNAASLAAFTRAQGFNPGSGFVQRGHNPNSLHYQNRALDVRLGGKSTEDVVNFMTKALEAGIRVVDERIKPKPGVVWTGPHVHIEENDKKASFFNPKLDYNGKLEYLKALDAERIAGKSKTVADALKGVETQTDKTGEKAKQFAETINGKFTDAINLLSPKMNLSSEAAKNLGDKSKFASAAMIEQANKVSDLFGDLSQATPAMRDQANAVAAQTIAYEKNNTILENLRRTMDNFGQNVSEMDKLNALFADPKVTAALQQRADALGETLDSVKGIMEATARAADNENNNIFGNLGAVGERGTVDPNAKGIGGVQIPQITPVNFPPPPIPPWDTFFGRLKQHFTKLEDDTRTTSQVLGDTLGQSLDRIQGIFTTAFGNLDGGFKNFFSSIAKGFADLVKEVIAQVLALLAVATIAGIITAIGGAGFGKGFKTVIKQGQGSGSIGGGILGGIFGGGGSGGSSSSGGDDGGIGDLGVADGGFVRGAGTSTSDSIPARLSNGEFVIKAAAVAKYGAGFFGRLNNMMGVAMPQFAMGGYVGGGSMPTVAPSMLMPPSSYSSSSSTTNNNSPISIVVNAPGGNPPAVRQAAAQGTNEALRRLQAQERRNK